MRRSKNKPEMIDVSCVISEDTEVYPGDPKPVIRRISGTDGSASVSLLSISTHTGTHIDPPLHIFPGKTGIDAIEPDNLTGWAEIHDVSHCKEITADELKKLELNEDIILLKTGRLDSYLTEDAAQYIAELKPETLGIDSLSVDGPGTLVSHRILLGKGIIVIEGLRFDEIEAGRYYFICLPLKIKNGDGGPARAIVIKNFCL